MESVEGLENIKGKAYELCQEFLGDTWVELPISEFRFTVVKQGLSNTKYRCALPENAVVRNPKTPRQILLRMYGLLQEDTNAIVTEVATFILLAEKKLGPKLYGVFPEGRLEEFIPSRSLLSKDYKVMYPAIARGIAKIHALDVPIKKIPDLLPVTMRKWLDEIKTDTILKTHPDYEYVDFYTEEIEWIIEKMKKSNSPVVYCHNDLLGGNILFREDSPSEEDPRLTFIDIEFASYNYRGFDIANQFAEWCFDYCTEEYPYFEYHSENFPNEEEQISYIRAYVEQLVVEGVIPSTSVEGEIRDISQEVQLFLMVSNLLWSLWFWKTSFLGKENFGYKECSEIRRNDFMALKKKYLNRAM